ncbi:hypothetical protein [Hymenobacter armeniacus]|uniref:Auto-transporter adhesin head GIN domain-containing protein n=1 Tax=Hymenobacter armeniacus TaxID=2771358 RepID=A0ABR8JYV7_9BACT|nr:hypothetical protein [Hymenobacter armeniacus]MBD2724213.1 hypothetical protein [Hymenobacter armeniacus]
MKTSNQLFAAGVTLLLGSLLTYNLALSAEYRTGHYKKPFYGYTALPLTNFSEVAVPTATRFSIKVVRGPYAVHLNEGAAKYVRISQQGQRLTVALAYPDKEEDLGNRETVIISCPELRRFTAAVPATVAGRRKGAGGHVVLENLLQDSLAVDAASGVSVQVVGSELAYLRVNAASGTELGLEKNNRIRSADVAVGDRGVLNQACGIEHPRYRFAATATAHFEGEAAQGLGPTASR